jgi:D-alanyl-D-alanine carboxypeptidase/D-alanyl-D-alanine-endopeptidase (penicillin-binding protein 4)
MAPGNWGIAVATDNGSLLWSVRPDQALIPASAVKLFTTGFARTVLGSDARRSTRILGNGFVDPATGEWVGTWALQVNGDPSLERANGSGPRLVYLARQLATRGVRRLTGPLEVQSAAGPAEARFPAEWSDRHRGRLFAPLVGPLTVHENVVRFRIRPGRKVGHRARLTTVSPDGIERLIAVKATTSAGRRSRLRVRPAPGGGWVVTGRIGIRSRGRYISVTSAEPRLVLEAVWGAALEQAGIEWDQSPARPPADQGLGPRLILAEVLSPPLDSIASDVNRRSHNLGAELMLQWAAGLDNGPALLTQHVQFITGQLEGVYLVDGSGLSSSARVTPRVFVSYLARLPQTEHGKNFPLLLPANGTGTLKRLRGDLPAEGVLRAKTGTLRNVSTVVGYLGHPEGVLLISLMYNGSRPSSARRAQLALVRELGANGIVVPSEWEEEPPRFGGRGDGWAERISHIR